MDPKIESLKNEGLIFLWAYTENSKNFPGWNISFDSKGSEFLLQLFRLMNKSAWSSKKKIEVLAPRKSTLTKINNLGGTASWIPGQSLVLHYKKEGAMGLWKISAIDGIVSIELGTNKLIALEHSIIEVQNKRDDFAIADDESESILYFWCS